MIRAVADWIPASRCFAAAARLRDQLAARLRIGQVGNLFTGRQHFLEFRKLQQQGRQALPRLVVQFAGDAAPFFFVGGDDLGLFAAEILIAADELPVHFFDFNLRTGKGIGHGVEGGSQPRYFVSAARRYPLLQVAAANGVAGLGKPQDGIDDQGSQQERAQGAQGRHGHRQQEKKRVISSRARRVCSCRIPTRIVPPLPPAIGTATSQTGTPRTSSTVTWNASPAATALAARTCGGQPSLNVSATIAPEPSVTNT